MIMRIFYTGTISMYIDLYIEYNFEVIDVIPIWPIREH